MTARRDFPPKAIELIYDFYGLFWAETLAKRIERETGFRTDKHAVIKKAAAMGLSARDAQGHIALWDAAELLGVNPRSLYNYLRLKGVNLLGRGKHRFVTAEQFEQLRTYYGDRSVPSVSLVEAARRLNYSRNQLQTLINQGRLKAFKHGSYWRVPLSALERFPREHRDLRKRA